MFMKDLNNIKQNLIQDYIDGISITKLSEKYKVSKIAEYSNQNNSLIQLCLTAHDYYNLKLKKSESIEFLHYLYDNCSIYLTRKYLRYKAFVNNHYEIPYNSTDINIFNII